MLQRSVYELNLLGIIRINIVFRTSNVNDVRQYEYAAVMRHLNIGLWGGGSRAAKDRGCLFVTRRRLKLSLRGLVGSRAALVCWLTMQVNQAEVPAMNLLHGSVVSISIVTRDL